MADSKISVLPASTTPLAGTEVLPIVQSGSTVKVAVSDLTAGRAMAALGMTLTSTDAGATAAPLLDLYRDSATPAASDTVGEIEFNGEDSAGNKQAYGVIHASILSPTSTAEQGQLHFETATAGALTEKMIIGTTSLVINEIGAIFNVRIEGDADANLFYTDATNDKVGIGTVSPAEKLDVVGKIKVSDNIVIGTSGKGIDFSATVGTGTSELLADYEEGTFTPVLAFGGASVGITYGTPIIGRYTKIGQMVFIQLYIALTSKGSSTGDATITGLPFTSASTTGVRGGASFSVNYNVSFADQIYGFIQSNTSVISLLETTNAGAITTITDTNFANDSEFSMIASYQV